MVEFIDLAPALVEGDLNLHRLTMRSTRVGGAA
jgi:hypothetical protein